MKAFATLRGWVTTCFAVSLIVAAADVDAGSKQRPGPPPPPEPEAVTQIVDGTPRPFPGQADPPVVLQSTGRGAPTPSTAPPVVTSLLTITDEAGMASPLGGDDIVVSSSLSFSTPFFQIASDGTAFVAVQAGQQLNVYRSADGGETWTLWSTFADPSYFDVHDFVVAEGTLDRAIVAYWVDTAYNQVRIAYADINAGVPTWTVVTVLASTGIEYGSFAGGIDIDTDAVDYASYYVYLVARGSDGNGDDIWFARSTTQGTSFAAGYRVVSETSSPNEWFGSPIVAYGDGDWIHLSYLDGSTTTDAGLLQRRAASWANAGLAAWEAPVTLEAVGNGQEVSNMAMAPRTVGGNVTVIVFTTTGSGWNGESRYSTDFGATWPGGNFGFLSDMNFGLSFLNMPAGNMAILGYSDDDDPLQPVLTRALFTPDTWSPPEAFSSHDWHMNTRTPRLAFDPTRGNRIAAVWGYQVGGNYLVRFDAEWRRDPGYPNTEVGFPISIAGGGQSPPAVAEVDGDAEMEIVFGTRNGDVHVVNHDGTYVPGFPVNIGSIPLDAAVAVGDLVGNGIASIIAPTEGGLVYAIDPEGAVMPGWPVDMGTNAAAYVSIGAFGPPYPRDVVVTSGKKVGLFNYLGVSTAPAWADVTYGTYSYAAAIGDVDNDGVTDIVSLTNSALYRHRVDSPSYFSLLVPGATFYDSPTLADIEADGTLEIAAPTAEGRMFVFKHSGADYPGWPVTVSPASPLTAGVWSQMLGTSEVELSFAELSGRVHVFYYTGVEQAGYPQMATPYVWMPPILYPVNLSVPNVTMGSSNHVAYSWRNIPSAVVPGWPKNLPGHVEETLAAGDIDNDGRSEIVVLGYDFLTVFDVNNPPPVNARASWPMYAHDARRTGCLDCAEDLTPVADSPSSARTIGIEIHPNPFNPVTTITYDVARAGAVTLAVYDVHGRRVETLIDGEHREPNRYSITYRGNLASGVYFVRLVAGGEEFARKMVVLK